MRLLGHFIVCFSVVLALLFSACGGPNGVRITEGNQGRTTTAPLIIDTAIIIVHVDLFERIVTIRNGMALDDEFLITTNYAGIETAVLKIHSNSIGTALLTADILAGNPKINHLVIPADAIRSQELGDIYRDINVDN